MYAKITAHDRYSAAKKIIDARSANSAINFENSEYALDKLYVAEMILWATIFVLIIASYWKPSSTCAYYHCIMLIYVMQEGMPAEFGHFWHQVHSTKLWGFIVMFTRNNFYSELFMLCHATAVV